MQKGTLNQNTKIIKKKKKKEEAEGLRNGNTLIHE